MTTAPRRFRRIFLGGLLFLVAMCAVAAQAPAPSRVVAVGDIHGDPAAFTAILREAGILDLKNQWIGKDVTLVQTGDAIDRGAGSRAVLDLLMALEKQAAKKRARFIPLLGNHEVMNITGDLRYLTPEIYATFANAKSEKRRQSAWKQYMEWRRERAKTLGKLEPVFAPQDEQAWLEAHPPGFFEHRDAFAPAGKYGKWLRQHDTVALVNGVLFVHGGLSPHLAPGTLADINKRVRDELKRFDEYVQYLVQQKLALPFFTLEELAGAVQEELDARRAKLAEKTAAATAEGKTYQPTPDEKRDIEILELFFDFQTWYSIHADGPLWFRGYAQWSREEGQPHVDKLLATHGAAAVVAGHTPLKEGRIRSRFGGKVFLIDTGMLAGYFEGGRGSALEISKGTFTAIYADQRVVVWPAPTAQPALTPVGKPQRDRENKEEESGGGLAPAGQQNSAAAPPARETEVRTARVWMGPDGQPLPFHSDDEVLDFLRTATVVSVKNVGQGVTKPRKVLLEKNGVRAHAIFRDVDQEKDWATMADGKRLRFFRDSYKLECAAYEMGRLLGLDNIPPVVQRKVHATPGSLQLWIENAMTENERQERKLAPPDQIAWTRQTQTMRLFDVLVHNFDRNFGNLLIDAQWKLWMVDHTRTFRRDAEVPSLTQIILCERNLWQRLRALDEATIGQRLAPFLGRAELEGLLQRRARLVKHLEELIAANSEERVLFSW